jgi:hypothetical protein
LDRVSPVMIWMRVDRAAIAELRRAARDLGVAMLG